MKTKTYLAVACLIMPESVVQERTTMDALKDVEIKLSLENGLGNHSGELYRDVSVDVIEGRVLLTGSVPQRQHKVDASRIAWETERRADCGRGQQCQGLSGGCAYLEHPAPGDADRS
jgi:osmotically-inducible protein OsmY